MRRLPSDAEWTNLCRQNHQGQTKTALRSLGWNRNGPIPKEPELAAGVAACWVIACKLEAHEAASALAGVGAVPAPSAALGAAVDTLVAKVAKDKYSPTRTRAQMCWAALARVLPGLTDAQAQGLAKAGRSEDLGVLLMRGAWRPAAREAFRARDALNEGGWSSRGEALLEDALAANPSLPAEEPERYHEAVYAMLRDVLRGTPLGHRLPSGMAAIRLATLVKLVNAWPGTGQAPPFPDSLPDAGVVGGVALVSAMGRAGWSLPEDPAVQGAWLRDMAAWPWRGAEDERAQAEPWQRWVLSVHPDALGAGGPAEAWAVWRRWSLENRLAAVPVAPARPRL